MKRQGKPIESFNMDGTLYKRYDDTSDAIADGHDSGSIYKVYAGKQKPSSGSRSITKMWRTNHSEEVS